MVGTTISHYKVLEKIGQGGIGGRKGLLCRNVSATQLGNLASRIRRALMSNKARPVLFLGLLVLIPSCSRPSSSPELPPELKARWEQAAYYGWPAEIPVLLDEGVDVNLKDKDGVTALMIAGMRANAKTVLTLLDAGADVNAKANNGATALMMAGMRPGSPRLLGWSSERFQSGQDNTETVQALLNAGADVNAKDQDGVTALMIHGARANRENVQALLDAGVDVNAKDNSGMSALSYAAREGYADILQTLLDMGAQLNKRDNPDQPTALITAAEKGHTEIVKFLLDAGAEPSGIALEQAAEGGHFGILKILSDAGAEPSDWALEQAAILGHFEMVKTLLDAGAEPSGVALEQAAEGGHFGIVKILLDAGAEPSDVALEQAAREGHLRSVKTLLDAGAEATDVALEQAASLGHDEIVSTLLAAGADITALTLEQAARWGQEEIVKSLLDMGADPNEYVEKSALMWAAGAQPLMNEWAVQWGHRKRIQERERRKRIVGLLLDAGAKENETDQLGFTPLKWAQMRDRPGVIELLRSTGAANRPEVTEVQVGKDSPDSMANEARAIASLKSLVTAELMLRSDPRFGAEGQGSYGTLLDLLSAGLINDRLGSANTDGYLFSVSFLNTTFYAIARPLAYRVTGVRSFYADETGVIRYTRENRPATAEDRPL